MAAGAACAGGGGSAGAPDPERLRPRCEELVAHVGDLSAQAGASLPPAKELVDDCVAASSPEDVECGLAAGSIAILEACAQRPASASECGRFAAHVEALTYDEIMRRAEGLREDPPTQAQARASAAELRGEVLAVCEQRGTAGEVSCGLRAQTLIELEAC